MGYRPWGRKSQTRLSKQTETSTTELLFGAAFLPYCRGNQLQIHMCPLLFFGFSSHLGDHRALSRVPCALYGDCSLGFWFILSGVHMSVPTSQFIPHHPPCPLGVHMFLLYVCVSSSALQIGSSVPRPPLNTSELEFPHGRVSS